MKKTISFLCLLLISQLLFSQAPQATSYQAVIRNSSGNALANQPVKVRFSIRDSSANGTIVYRETQSPTTNAQGLINLFAGQGTATTGTFATINWGSKSKFLQTEIDITGGNNFTDMGTTQLMSVPYALYANTANTAVNGNPNGTTVGEMLYWNGATWVKIAPGTYGQSLTICDGIPTWGGCAPKLTTNSISSVSFTSATGGGNITADGGASVTARGVCWSTSANPTIALSTKTLSGTGSGSFSSFITGLTPNTLYHVRAYATNSVGTSYGSELTFTTLATTLPTITTTVITAIANTTANSGGSIGSDGGSAITEKGVCWSTSPNPTISLSTKTNNGTGSGSFTSNITGLTAGVLYYVRAYATNNLGTAYGAQQTFTTVTLPSVTIGSQAWSTKNLNVTTYRNGDPIPQVTDPTQWANLTTGAWCWYNNDSATYAATYGRLYNWYAVNDSRGIAPLGWHIPTDNEWVTLENRLGGSSVAGGLMKSETGWTLPNTGATNSSGFSALPGGMRTGEGVFSTVGTSANFWSTTELSATNAWYRYLFNEGIALVRFNAVKRLGLSVRIVGD
jgi:uncharacterized protein (TIGR02145 family)